MASERVEPESGMANTSRGACRLASFLVAGLALWPGPAQALEAETDNICRRGDGKDVSFTLQDSPDTEKLHVTVNSDYFPQFLAPRPNSTRRSLRLRINVEDFSPRGSSKALGQNTANILIYPVRELSSIARSTHKVASGYKGTDDVILEDAVGPFGLTVFTSRIPENPITGKFYQYYDVFFSRDDNQKMSEMIRCRNDSREAFRMCTHLIERGWFDIDVSYHTDRLPDWKRISENAGAFLTCISTQE